MSIKSQDIKILWARSGNMCNFPGCGIELSSEETSTRVLGEEAHIRGEKPTSARYDPNQSPDERESHLNRILLCPTHHTMVDANPSEWTIEKLLEFKSNHERQVKQNWRHPQFMNEIKNLVRQFDGPDESSNIKITDIIEENKGSIIVRVNAAFESGINTNIKVFSGQKIQFFARGLISYDSRQHYATPEGFLCNEYGIPLSVKEGETFNSPVIWPHLRAFKTNGGDIGRIGSLIGWIDKYSKDNSFLIGTKREIVISEEGYLYLGVNDVEGAYSDNDGEFRVDIRLIDQ